MKQLVAALAVLVAVVAGLMWATSRSSSAQEQESPTGATVPEEDLTIPLDDLGNAIKEFIECLRDQGIEVPDLDRGEGRFGFHLDFDTEDLEALTDAREECGDALFLGEGGLPFDLKPFHLEGLPFGDGLLFGDRPFGGELGGNFMFGGARDLDVLAECLSVLGTFENVDEVKAQLEECLAAFGDFEPWLPGIDGQEFPFGGRRGFGSFQGPGQFRFDFDLDFDGEFNLREPGVEDPGFEGAAA